MSIPANIDTATRGKRIQEMVTKLVAARDTGMPRREMPLDGPDDRFLRDALGALVNAGVLHRKRGAEGIKGVPAFYSISNWDAAQRIVDAKDMPALYRRWVVDPPSRKLPSTSPPPVAPATVTTNGHSNGAGASGAVADLLFNARVGEVVMRALRAEGLV